MKLKANFCMKFYLLIIFIVNNAKGQSDFIYVNLDTMEDIDREIWEISNCFQTNNDFDGDCYFEEFSIRNGHYFPKIGFWGTCVRGQIRPHGCKIIFKNDKFLNYIPYQIEIYYQLDESVIKIYDSEALVFEDDVNSKEYNYFKKFIYRLNPKKQDLTFLIGDSKKTYSRAIVDSIKIELRWTLETTTPQIETTTEIKTTTENVTTTVIETTTENVQINETTLVPSIPNIQCRQNDAYGRIWEGVGRENVHKKCPNSQIGENANWFCQENGQFLNSQPKYQCEPFWIGAIEQHLNELLEEFEDGLPLNQTESLLYDVERNLISAINYPTLENENLYHGDNIWKMLSLLEKISTTMDCQDYEISQLEIMAGKAIELNYLILSHEIPWAQIEDQKREREMTKLIQNLETTWNSLLLSRIEPNGTSYRKEIEFDHLKMMSGLEISNNSGKFIFPSNANRDEDSYIELPDDWIKYYNLENFAPKNKNVYCLPKNSEVKFSSQLIPLEQIQGKFQNFDVLNEDESKDFELNGPLMSFSFLPLKMPQNKSQEAKIKIHFKLENRASKSQFVGANFKKDGAKCVYWDAEHLIWSTNGCQLVENESNGHFITCMCNHLTSFAVLMGKQDSDKTLVVITIILCSMSNILLALTVYILHTRTNFKNSQGTISKCICLMLFLGNIIIILLNPIYFTKIPKSLCQTAGILMHYTFLCAWAWMATMATHLFLIIQFPFESQAGKFNFNFKFSKEILAFGTPLLWVGGVAGFTTLNAYSTGEEDFCFLKGNYIWTFLGPITLIILLNLSILVFTFVKVRKMAQNPSRVNNNIDHKNSVLGWAYLTITLGLTYIPGYFLFVDSTPISAYAFTILNASQGLFIFIFHFVLKEQFKKAINSIQLTHSKGEDMGKLTIPRFSGKLQTSSQNADNQNVTYKGFLENFSTPSTPSDLSLNKKKLISNQSDVIY